MALTQSSIGKKVIMAVTGLIWVGYVVMHMYGNLKVFFGAEYFNHYAEGLRALGEPVFGHLHLLTLARIVLVGSIVAHIWAALSLTRQAQIARPQRYAVTKRVEADYASLTMRWGGLTILLFVIFHLAHLTWGVPILHNNFIRGDAYHNLVSGFQNPINVGIYLLAVIALGFHLYHGTWSMCQTLGITNRTLTPSIRAVAWALAILIPVGFAAVPLAVLVGIVTL
ncbi:MAG: succinate dehydrogenase cytochrome b subunit [Caldilineaceae bacterium]|nr:succinate dehydrogenase cytochrome b subunit [Caldilineaceae bacterium]